MNDLVNAMGNLHQPALAGGNRGHESTRFKPLPHRCGGVVRVFG